MQRESAESGTPSGHVIGWFGKEPSWARGQMPRHATWPVVRAVFEGVG
jgi:hypothetical protein